RGCGTGGGCPIVRHVTTQRSTALLRTARRVSSSAHCCNRSKCPEHSLLRTVFQILVDNVPFVIAPFLFLWSRRGRFFVRQNRNTAQVILEPRLRKNKHDAGRLGAGVLEAHPGIRRNERHSSGMQIAFLTAESSMQGSRLEEDNFILTQVFVSRDLVTG